MEYPCSMASEVTSFSPAASLFMATGLIVWSLLAVLTIFKWMDWLFLEKPQ